MTRVNKILNLLTRAERKQLWLLLMMLIMAALLEMLGVAAILPFLTFLGDPEMLHGNALLSAIYMLLGFTDTHSFSLFLGAMVFVVLLASISVKALNFFMQQRFSLICEYNISRRLTESYLHQPYGWFLDKHSADLAKNVVSEVQTATASISSLLTLISQSCVVTALLGLLILVDIRITLITSIVITLFYLFIVRSIRIHIFRLGNLQFTTNAHRYAAINEAFAATKDIKMGGLEGAYIKRFAKPAHDYAITRNKILFLRNLPRYLLEAIIFGVILVFLMFSLATSNGINEILPIISVYVFASLRLMPASQQIYTSIIQLRVGDPALDQIHSDLKNINAFDNEQSKVSSMQLQNSIRLDNITFFYPNTSKPTLRNLKLTIPANRSIGLVGATGSGKTTTVDLIMGLITPQKGNLIVDGRVIDSTNTRDWQKSIGYVPQQIYLTDDSVAANVAFGVDPDQVNMTSVERASRISNLHAFVSKELPLGYETTVGERGVRLSGGQRQRIGIARALYHNPAVLILDEATSALDNLTEKVVMEAVNNLHRSITIIMIAHRLTTVRQCDCLYLLEEGQVKESGTYEELQASSQTFQRMAESV